MDENSFILLVKRLNYELGGTKQSKPYRVLGGNVLHWQVDLRQKAFNPSLFMFHFNLQKKKKKSLFNTSMGTEMEGDRPDDSMWGEK